MSRRRKKLAGGGNSRHCTICYYVAQIICYLIRQREWLSPNATVGWSVPSHPVPG